jgi:hypothetical protein
MANPLAVGGDAAVAAVKGSGPGGAPKKGASQFDKVRESARQRQVLMPAQLPPVTQISADQKRMLRTELRKKLDQNEVRSPGQLFRTDIQNAHDGVRRLSHKINALPKTPDMEPLRSRFAAIESRYRNSSKMLSKIPNLDSPRDLLQVQVQLYSLTQDIEIVSKVVDQVNTGTKQILQTQV